MKTILVILLSSFFLMASCHKEETSEIQTDQNGVIISLPYHWKKTLHLSGNFESNSQMKARIEYNGKVGVPMTNGADNKLLGMLDSKTGEILWNWDDRFSNEEDVRINYNFIFNNLMTYQNKKRSYCINLENGETKWKENRNNFFDVRVFKKDSNTFYNLETYTNNEGYLEQVGRLCDINTGELSLMIKANLSGNYISGSNIIGAINNIDKLPNSSNLFAITYAEPLPDWKIDSFLGLYNSETEEWVYERKSMATPTFNTSVFWQKIYDNKLYANVGKTLVCHDLDTGEQLWSKQFYEDFSFSGFIIEDGIIIANNEDTFTYGINPENGAILWKEKSSGTSGYMSYLNGIVYFVGGSSGKLHAIDSSTGKTVWKIDASKLGEENDFSYFNTNAVYVFPAKNGQPARVIATTFYNAYSFEAYQ